MELSEKENIQDPYQFTSDEKSNEESEEGDNEGSGNEEIVQPLQPLSLTRRKRQDENHKRQINKQNVQRGLERRTKSGRIIKATKFKAQTLCKCRISCSEKIDVLRQQELFTAFYENSDATQKTLILRASTSSSTTNKKIEDNFLPIIPLKKREIKTEHKLVDGQGVSQKVCKQFFLGLYQVSPSRVYRAIKSAISNPSAFERRGRSTPPNKTSAEARNGVHRFVNKIPKYESHYGRSTSKKNYLAPDLTMRKLFVLYKSWCLEEGLIHVSNHIFGRIFHTDYNLSFKRRHKDTCKTCDSFKATLQNPLLTPEERENTIKLQQEHWELGVQIQTQFKEDVAMGGSDTAVLTFDLQKALATPFLSVNSAFYKRQLWTYNLCIYDEVEKKGYMYVWTENVASRGGQEIGSCLLIHFATRLQPGVKKIILYSDSCGGQNRNIKVALMLKHFLASSNVDVIAQRFFLSGHSYNSCDRCFSSIEKKSREKEVIATPDAWIEIIESAKEKDPKFEVRQMLSGDFYSASSLQKKVTNRKQDVYKEKINWLLCRSLVYRKEKTFTIEMYYDAEEYGGSIKILDIQKRKVSEDDFVNTSLVHLFPFGRPITKAKYDDLMDLMEFIPEECRAFYEGLNSDDKTTDYGLASGVSDNEED